MNGDIAIIGMAGRFPEADTIAEFYDHLKNGRDCIREISDRRRRETSLDVGKKFRPIGFIEGIDRFDYRFFGYTKGDAELIDPVQRVLLEVVHEMFENAGYDPKYFDGTNTAVFAGAAPLQYHALCGPDNPSVHYNSIASSTTARISYFYNLRGTAETIDTACSSSLVALHRACKEILSGDAEYVIVCGANLNLFPMESTIASSLGILSPDGKTKSFSDEAQGTGSGEAFVALLLKSVERATADGDTIHAVIKGSAVNQDARLSASLAAPNSIAQSEVIQRAWKNADIDPKTVTYIEAHGTATKLGDPVEIEGLNLAFRNFTKEKAFCAVASVKSNLGHTDGAAGIVGVVKAVLSLKNKVLFPSVNFKRLNPLINLNESPLYINTTFNNWTLEKGDVRRAGVSAFGLSGTNCHVVLEEWNPQVKARKADVAAPPYLFTFSAKSEKVLIDNISACQSWLETKTEFYDLHDLSFTLTKGRGHYQYRLSFLASDTNELRNKLSDAMRTASTPLHRKAQPKIIGVFSHNAKVQDDVIATLLLHEEFRKAFEECAPYLTSEVSDNVKVFCFQYSLFHLLTSWSITTDFQIVDGVGKIVLKRLKKEISLAEGIRLAAEYNQDEPGNLNERLAELVRTQSEAEPELIFLEYGFPGNLTRALCSVYDAERVICLGESASIDQIVALLLKQLWDHGVEIGWGRYWSRYDVKVLTLPTYRFEKERCWVQQASDGRISDWIYELSWKPGLSSTTSNVGELPGKRYLIVSFANDMKRPLAEYLEEKNTSYIFIECGEQFQKESPSQYLVNPEKEFDFLLLKEELDGLSIDGAIFLSDDASSVELTQLSRSKKIAAFFHLAKLLRMSLPKKGFTLSLATCRGSQVYPGEAVNLENGCLVSFLRSLVSDFPTLNASHIDFDKIPEPQSFGDALFSHLLSGDRPRFIAFRAGEKFVPQLSRRKHKSIPPKYEFQTDGIYIVTGGLTGIGLEVAFWLASNNVSHIMLFGRTALPKPTDRNGHIRNGNGSDPRSRLKAFQALQAFSRARIEYHTIDVSDEKQLAAWMQRQNLPVKGIFHAAGLVQSTKLKRDNLFDFRSVLLPKVEGSVNLLAMKPDFLVLFSSLNALMPLKNSHGYTVANAFQDMFAQRMSSVDSRVVAINWPTWNKGDFFYPSERRNVDEREMVNKADALLLLSHVPLLNNSSFALIKEQSLKHAAANPFCLLDDDIFDRPASSHKRDTGKISISKREIEDNIFQLWVDVFKSQDFTREDDFFAIGGNSLSGIQLLNSIKDHFSVELELEHLYEYSTVASLSIFIEGMLRSTRLKTTAVVKIDDQQDYELSSAQKRIWTISHFDKTCCAYNISTKYLLKGAVKSEVLLKAFHTVIARHEILRTNFIVRDGQPRQVVRHLSELQPDFQFIEESNSQVMLEMEKAEGSRPFNLERDSLIRLRVIKVSEEEFVLLLTVHHIVIDGWSMFIFFREMLQCYNSIDARQHVNLNPLSIQYRDFAHWQNRIIDQVERNEHKEFWTTQCSESIPLLELPVDFKRPEVKSFNGANLSSVIDPAITERLREVARHNDVSLFNCVFTALFLFLYKYTHQTDIVIGTNTAGRSDKALEDQIGFYVNTLPIRFKVDGTNGLAKHLQTFKKLWLEVIKHEIYPFEKIVQELPFPPDVSRSPLFDVLAVFHNQHTVFQQPEGIQSVQVNASQNLNTTTSKFDLTFSFTEQEHGMLLAAEYNTDIFLPATISRILSNFCEFLKGLSDDPMKPVDTVLYLSSDELAQISEFGGSHGHKLRLDESIIDLISAQSCVTPDKIALTCGDRSFSYTFLDDFSTRLASRLTNEFGIRSGDYIGMCLSRTENAVVSILGILKTGACLVPVDSNLPDERIRLMLDELPVSLMLIEPDSRVDYDAVLVIDAGMLRNLKPASGAHLNIPLSSPSFVIFTSGTTGKPKGIVQTHETLINLIRWDIEKSGLDRGLTLMQYASFSFDASLHDILFSLSAGGDVYLLSEEERYSIYHLKRILLERKIAIFSLPYSVLANFFSAIEIKDLSSHRIGHIISTGEQLFVEKGLLDFMTAFPTVKLHNFYGPSETHVVTAYSITGFDDIPYKVSIGKPISNTELCIVDAQRSVVGIGVIGEVYVGGANLALGYLNRPELTAEKFIRMAPFGAHHLFYKTGDLARWEMDGNITFLGRNDTQIKVNGNRVELDEIKSVLLKHPDIRSAAVQVDTRSGENVIVTFVVGRHEGLSVSSLRKYLSRTLPDYMMPRHFAIVHTLPLTSNGKLDLGKVDLSQSEKGAGMGRVEGGLSADISPADGLESDLIAIWKKTLKDSDIGLQDNFFTLGGHSLQAIMILYEVNRKYAIEIPLVDLLDDFTIKRMAQLIRSKSARKVSLFPEVQMDKENEGVPFPLTDIQQAYWLGRSSIFELGNVGTHDYREVDVNHLDLERFIAAFQKLVRRHGMLRAIITPDGEQQIIKDYVIERKILDIRNYGDNEKAHALEAIRQKQSREIMPLNKPLFLLTFTLISSQITRVHFGLDAIIADAWSEMLMMEELIWFYENPEQDLPALSLSFRDWVIALKKFEQSKKAQISKEYWTRRLSTLASSPELTLAKNPELIKEPKYFAHNHIIEADKWSRIKAIAAEHNVTASIVVLAAFSEVLAVWGRNKEFTLNLTLFNRMPVHEEVNHLVGDFTSINLLSVNVDYDRTFAERARQLQKQFWDDLEHRHYSGIQVIRDLARVHGNFKGASMPVVVSSTLGFDTPELVQESKLSGEQVYRNSQTSQVWIDHQVSESAGNLSFIWSVVEKLFPEGYVEAMFYGYISVLDNLIDPQNWHQKRLTIFSEESPQLQSGIAIGQGYGENLVAGFEEHVRMSPDALAVITSSASFTYRELNQISNSVAEAIRLSTNTRNSGVAIVMHKGWEQVAAAVGILKAGMYYVPIDAGWPSERINHIINNSNIRMAVVQPGVTLTAEMCGIETFTVTENLKSDDVHNLDLEINGDDFAYVIFTSGSTGKPKGVVIDHRGAINTVLDINARFGISQEDRLLAVSELSFDLSVYDIFGALNAGAAIVMPDLHGHLTADKWIKMIRTNKVTVWNSVPALLELLLHSIDDNDYDSLESLRLVMLSGDWIPVALPDQFKRRNMKASLVSLGGATEASIWSIFYPIGNVEPDWTSIPYGKSLANQSVYVLDKSLYRCPTWAIGDIYIAGVGLAKGYLNDPEKTHAAFIRHPQTGEVYYKTGDLGRYLPDGNIEFLGRNDFQVKIGGHRIELGEIENSMREHPDIREAIVAVNATNNVKKLVGYIVKKDERANGFSLFDYYNQIKNTDVVPETFHIRNPATIGKSFSREHGDSVNAQERTIETTRIDIRQVSDLLKCLKQMESIEESNAVLPKYLYPSAGNLYPVRVYLSIQRSESVDGECYYYHPSRHSLIAVNKKSETLHRLVRDEASNVECVIFFVAKLDAIVPQYREKSLEFVYLEAGYMSHLLGSEAASNGLALQPCINFDRDNTALQFGLTDDEFIVQGFNLSAHDDGYRPETNKPLIAEHEQSMEMQLERYQVLRAETQEGSNSNHPQLKFKLLQKRLLERDESQEEFVLANTTMDDENKRYFLRQSFRTFDNRQIANGTFHSFLSVLNEDTPRSIDRAVFNADLEILILVKPDAVEGVHATHLKYDRGRGQLVAMPNDGRMEVHPFTGLNKQIWETASFALFIVTDRRCVMPALVHHELKRLFMAAGSLGQRLMEASLIHAVGVCPIGTLDRQIFTDECSLSSDHMLLHSFIGGHVDATRFTTREPLAIEATFSQQIQRFLSRQLPSYMIPSVFMELDAVPLSPNGKVDRKALPVPVIEDAGAVVIPPRTDAEKELAIIWTELLNLSSVSVTDNFFEKGGNSLVAMQLIGQISKRMKVRVDLTTVYKCTNLEELALEVEALVWATPHPAHLQDGAEEVII